MDYLIILVTGILGCFLVMLTMGKGILQSGLISVSLPLVLLSLWMVIGCVGAAF